jgi:hypothetical protein
VGLKEYRCRWSPVSKIADKEDTFAALWYAGVLSVKNAVGEPIPAFCQEPETGAKRPSVVIGQETGDVLPDQPAGPEAVNKCKIFEGEVATRISQSSSLACDREGLAGSAGNKKVNWSITVLLGNRGEVP